MPWIIILTVILVVLKFTLATTMPWWVIVLPIALSVGLAVIAFVLIVLFGFLAALAAAIE